MERDVVDGVARAMNAWGFPVHHPITGVWVMVGGEAEEVLNLTNSRAGCVGALVYIREKEEEKRILWHETCHALQDYPLEDYKGPDDDVVAYVLDFREAEAQCVEFTEQWLREGGSAVGMCDKMRRMEEVATHLKEVYGSALNVGILLKIFSTELVGRMAGLPPTARKRMLARKLVGWMIGFKKSRDFLIATRMGWALWVLYRGITKN